MPCLLCTSSCCCSGTRGCRRSPPSPPPRRSVPAPRRGRGGRTHHGVGAVQQAHDGQQEPPPPVRLEPGRRLRAALPEQAGRLGTLHRGSTRRGSAPGSTLPSPAPPRRLSRPPRGGPGCATAQLGPAGVVLRASPRCGAAPGPAPAPAAPQGRSAPPRSSVGESPGLRIGAAEGRRKGDALAGRRLSCSCVLKKTTTSLATIANTRRRLRAPVGLPVSSRLRAAPAAAAAAGGAGGGMGREKPCGAALSQG